LFFLPIENLGISVTLASEESLILQGFPCINSHLNELTSMALLALTLSSLESIE